MFGWWTATADSNEVHAGGSATDAHWDAGLPLGHGGGPEGLWVGHVSEGDPRGGPFNIPASVAIAPSGEVFVADGYANCRVHRFSAEGEHLASWGAPGDGPGQFHLPHGIWVDRHGRLLVADRENDRVQMFTQDGDPLGQWPTKLIGPATVFVDGEDVAYVPEHNGGLFSVLTLEGSGWRSGDRR